MSAKIAGLILLLAVLGLTGCVSTNPDHALRTIRQWIPPGTPQAEAILIMKQHGYESGPCARNRRHPTDETVFCFWHDTKILKNSRWFFGHFQNGRLISMDGWGTGNNFFLLGPGPSER